MTAIVTISEAARLTGKDRKTIRRHLGNGTLSACPMGQHGTGDGTGIAISELVRAYGQLRVEMPHPASGEKGTAWDSIPHPHAPPQNEVLEVQNRANRELIAVLERQIEALEQDKRDLKAQVMALLAAPAQSTQKKPPEPSPEVANKPWSFWRIGN